MKKALATLTLSACALLFAVVSNLYQPPMDFNLHCTVHDRVTAALGGTCDMTLGGIFTTMTALVLSTFIFVALFFALRIVARDMMETLAIRSATARAFVRPDTPLHEFYYHGIADSRKFL